MSFSGPIRAEWLQDGRLMRLLEPVTYTDANGRQWTAPAGLVTDGASIPQALWSSVGSPFTGLYRIAAVLHDWAYNHLGVSKDDADAMFRECAIECGCSHFLAELVFEGVHLGGLGSYTGDQKDAAIALGSATA